MKAKNTTLTAAVVLAMGATTSSHANLDANDGMQIDIASGSLIEEGQKFQEQQGHKTTDKIVVAKRKAAPKRKTPTTKR